MYDLILKGGTIRLLSKDRSPRHFDGSAVIFLADLITHGLQQMTGNG